MTSYAFNGTLAFVAAITLIYCAGDQASLFANPNQAPFVQLFLNSTKSKAATVIMVIPITLCFFSALISEVATASRQLWSFARDGGLPFASFLEPVGSICYPQEGHLAANLFIA
jgi:amino acid transporter